MWAHNALRLAQGRPAHALIGPDCHGSGHYAKSQTGEQVALAVTGTACQRIGTMLIVAGSVPSNSPSASTKMREFARFIRRCVNSVCQIDSAHLPPRPHQPAHDVVQIRQAAAGTKQHQPQVVAIERSPRRQLAQHAAEVADANRQQLRDSNAVFPGVGSSRPRTSPWDESATAA